MVIGWNVGTGVWASLLRERESRLILCFYGGYRVVYVVLLWVFWEWEGLLMRVFLMFVKESCITNSPRWQTPLATLLVLYSK